MYFKLKFCETCMNLIILNVTTKYGINITSYQKRNKVNNYIIMTKEWKYDVEFLLIWEERV
jgi:hypothetical protein